MKIKLIAPHEQSENSIATAMPFKVQRVNLSLLAALTPPGHPVTIVDEAFAPDDMNETIDLLGITVMTDLALRAYRIADSYRQRGTKVVMGGIHATILPYEALQHADAVVMGEAEEIWPRLVSDAASGKLKKLYRADKLTDLKGLPRPRRDLYPRPASKSPIPLIFGIETSRGCPYDCEFCSIGSVMGRQYRFRPVLEVISEIESIESAHVFFVDDALGLNRAVAKKLFAEMIPLRRMWVGEGTVSLAEDLELLRLMRRSGCLGLLIGFESVQKDAQDGMRKIRNLRIDFPEAMRRFHDEGIAILGAFIFGFDHENKDVFDQTLEFAMENHLDHMQLRILTPYPGARLYTRLLNEGRLFVSDWWLHGYPPDTLLFQPKGMGPDELLDGFARLNRQAYSLGGIVKRFFGMSPWKRTAIGCSAYIGLNLAARKAYFRGLGNPQPFGRSPDVMLEVSDYTEALEVNRAAGGPATPCGNRQGPGGSGRIQYSNEN
jgi:radical SAM superfamily enzyme YgiQ (UPF0313 family)